MKTTQHECARYRDQLLDEQHGRLDAPSARALQQHLEECASCASLDRQERWLTDLLRMKLAQPRAPKALRERLEAQFAPDDSAASTSASAVAVASPRRVWKTRTWAALAAVAALAAAVLLAVRAGITGSSEGDVVLREALNDHLRVIYAEHPIEIESGGIHQVKPWFTGRLDFAPDIAFSGDADFPLVGGAVGYFIDRKAATFVFKRRLHTISCFVFRSNELPWRAGAERAIAAGMTARVERVDGWNAVLWRAEGLGHACVSDVSDSELMTLASKLVQR